MYGYLDEVKVALISALGNWFGDFVLYPLDTISTRLKASKFVNHNPVTFAITSIKNEKFKLFRGVQLSFPAAFLPTFAYVAVYDWGMKTISNLVEKYNYKDSVKLIFPFFVSSIA